MAKATAHYEPKVTFNGTFKEMIAVSTTGAGTKKPKSNGKK